MTQADIPDKRRAVRDDPRAADDLRAAFLTSDLTDDQRADLLEASDVIAFEPGEVLYVEGEPADALWILLDGQLELTRQGGAEEVVVATMATPGQWAGGLRAWGEGDSAAGYMTTGRGAAAGRILRVPSPELRRLIERWFPFGRHLIDGLWQTVRMLETATREREALVSLGTMAAGLAHEINNPAAASVRAVDSLGSECDGMLSSLTRLGELTITADQFIALDSLRVEAADADPGSETSLAVADREEAIGQWLDDRGIADAWVTAPVFAAAGVESEWCERLEKAVGPSALDPALRWVASTLSANALLAEIADSTNRVSQLVEAVKSYTQMDRAPRQHTNIRDGIESTVAMLAHKLRDVDVVTDFGTDVPEMEAYPAELNQVWTNVIDNAIAAMDGHGTLTITTSRADEDVVVEFTDTGSGMTPDVLARAFEPFFTTRGVGQGTGLGLDISRRIVVDRHRGDITFDSSPAGTTARIRLPLTH